MPSIGVGASRGVTIPITDSTVASVTVTPMTGTSQSVGGTLTYIARSQNAAGRSLPGKTYTKTIADALIGTGVVTGRKIVVTLIAIGATTVKATTAAIDSATAVVTSVAGRVQSFTVDTDPVTLAANDVPLDLTIAMALNEFDVDLVALGETVDTLDDATSDDEAVCMIGNLTITPVGVGSTTVHLTLDDATLDVAVTVTA